MTIWFWRGTLALMMSIIVWLAWALWWPVDPPVRILNSRAEPAVVKPGQTITLVQEAEFTRSTVVTVTPRLVGPQGLYFFPAIDQQWQAGKYEVRRILEVPPLAPGRWIYQPTFRFAATPLRDEFSEGKPIEFEVLP